jgi:arylsulfatase A
MAMLLLATVVVCGLSAPPPLSPKAGTKPNMIFIMADDLGYGDLSGFGNHPTSETPHLDAMVRDGARFTSMYSASPVCSPSRSSVMTGRLMTRNGVWPMVFSPNSVGGMALNETTLPALLKTAGYDTFMAGKWHLGVGKDGAYLPHNRGFDHYYGVPYGIDMCAQEAERQVTRDGFPAGACFAPNVSCASPQAVGGHRNGAGREYETPCPFYVNGTIAQQPTPLLALDDKYVEATTGFIKAHAAGTGAAPFFVYFASHHTHAPAFAKANFTNSSIRGWFGDHLRTLDWTVGEILAAVDGAGLGEETLVMFSADNGPSLTWEDLGGANGGLRCGKGTTWEGGQRVPSIARWTGHVQPHGHVRAMTSSMDFFATAAELAGAALPADRTYDSISYASLLADADADATRQTFFYWGEHVDPKLGLQAVRHAAPGFGDWKMHWITQGSHCEDDFPDKECPASRGKVVLEEPLLYNLAYSVGETRNLSVAAYPEVVAKLTALKLAHEAEPDIFGPSQVNKGTDNALEPCASEAIAAGCSAANPNATTPPWPLCCTKAASAGWRAEFS